MSNDSSTSPHAVGQSVDGPSMSVELNSADTMLLQTVKGIGAATARRIVRYRELIGGFTSTEQLLKVWGITPESFVRIEEQVRVDTTTLAFSTLRAAHLQRKSRSPNFYPSYSETRHYRPRENESRMSRGQPSQSVTTHVPGAGQSSGNGSQPTQLANAEPKAPLFPRRQLDINTADSSALVEISGIGPASARNIVKYRSLIFFYESLDQLSEVWGIRPENLERMKPYLKVGDDRNSLPHLKINEMGVDELGRHKYLGFKDARIIVAYRDMHGPFADMAALRQVQVITEEKWQKLEPYIVF